MRLLWFLLRAFAPARKAPPRAAPPRRQASRAAPARREQAPRATVVRVETIVAARQRILSGPAWVIDGDTIVIDRINIRLAGIDAPELDHPWGQKSKWALVALTRGRRVTAHVTGEMSYDRVVARCLLDDGRDLAAELVRQGLAIDWPKYSGGCYRALEPEGVRKRLWRADARQRGRFPG